MTKLQPMHVRISSANRTFIKAEAKREGIPQNAMLDQIINQVKAQRLGSRRAKKVKK